MTITTKYDIGQTVYFFYEDKICECRFDEDKQLAEGVITGIRYVNSIVEYEVSGNGDRGWFELIKESDLYTDKPFFENKYDQFFDQFPELNERDRMQLRKEISRARKEAAKNI